MGTSLERDSQSSVYRGVVSLSVGVAIVLVVNLWLMYTADVSQRVMSAWLIAPACALLLVFAVGLWARASSSRARHFNRVVVWAYLGALFLGIGGGLSTYVQTTGSLAVVVRSAVGWAVGGLLPGGLVGIYDAERRIERVRSEQAREEAEQLAMGLSVIHRVLRHDFRNHMTVLEGHFGALEEGNPERVESMREHTDRLVELADRARKMEELLRTEEGTVVDASGAVANVIEECWTEYENAEFRIDCPEETPVSVRGQLETAVMNLVENAVVHNDSDTPTVEASVESTDSAVEIVIRDNGPGIPQYERNLRNRPGETALEHSSGTGLWLVDWFAEQSDGSLTIETTEDGSVVTLSLPRTSADV